MPRRQIWPNPDANPRHGGFMYKVLLTCILPRATKYLPVGTWALPVLRTDSGDGVPTNFGRLAAFWGGVTGFGVQIAFRMRDSFRNGGIGLLATQTKNCWRCQVHSDSSSWLC